MALNSVVFTGNVVADITLEQTQSGKAYCKFSLAVNRAYSNGSEQSVDYIPCIAWDNQARAIAKYCGKGSKLSVVGSLQINTYKDKGNNTRTAVQVVVKEQDFLGDAKPTDGEPRKQSSGTSARGDTSNILDPPF